ncbi:MAG: permease [Spirochaetales bacterium]|nr:permease [Spirochaetales bacterium]
MKKILKKYKLILLAIVLYGIFFIFKRDIFFTAINMTGSFLLEMLQVLPPVLVISALITVWVPSELIRKSLGNKSGIKGKLLSLVIGSISAGPIYAAFPAVLVLFKKGASVSNLVIILSSWAVIKAPMVLVEINFLGLRFALTRVALTIPAILVMGHLVEKLVKRENIGEKTENTAKSIKDIESRLPNLNCGACDYSDCSSFAEGVFQGETTMKQCVVLQKQIKSEVSIIGQKTD